MHSISFNFAADADQSTVLNGLESIAKYFGIESTSIAPENVTATPPSIVTDAVGGDLDTKGLPWDERIHASTKAKNADGSWRSRKGVSDAVKVKVEKELGTVMAAPVLAAPVLALPTPTLALVNPAYQEFVEFIANNTVPALGARLTPEWVSAALLNFGVEGGQIQNLQHRTDLIPQIKAAIQQALGG